MNEKDAFVSRSTFHILNAIKYIADIENLDISKEENIPIVIEKAISIIYEIVEKEMVKRGELYTHDKFFKEISTNKLIIKFIVDKYRADALA